MDEEHERFSQAGVKLQRATETATTKSLAGAMPTRLQAMEMCERTYLPAFACMSAIILSHTPCTEKSSPALQEL